MLVVEVLIDFAGGHDLRQTAQRFIRHGECHVGENQHTLRDKLPPTRTPDGFAVVVLIQTRDLMHQRQCFAAAEVPAVDVQVTGVAQIVLLAANVVECVQCAVVQHMQRMEYGAPNRGEQYQHNDRADSQNQAPHITSSGSSAA